MSADPRPAQVSRETDGHGGAAGEGLRRDLVRALQLAAACGHAIEAARTLEGTRRGEAAALGAAVAEDLAQVLRDIRIATIGERLAQRAARAASRADREPAAEPEPEPEPSLVPLPAAPLPSPPRPRPQPAAPARPPAIGDVVEPASAAAIAKARRRRQSTGRGDRIMASTVVPAEGDPVVTFLRRCDVVVVALHGGRWLLNARDTVDRAGLVARANKWRERRNLPPFPSEPEPAPALDILPAPADGAQPGGH